MSILADIRREYPEFRDLSDRELSEVLRKKYYSGMPKDQFQKQISTSISFPTAANIPPPVSVPVRAPVSAPVSAPVTRTAAPTAEARLQARQPLKEVEAPGIFDYFTDRDAAIKQARERRAFMQELGQRGALEDIKTQTGFFDRLGDFFSRGLLSTTASIKDTQRAIEADPVLRKQFTEEARRFAADANVEIKDATQWEDVKKDFLRNAIPFAIENVAQSIPGMIAAAAPLPGLGISNVFGSQAREAAELEGRQDVELSDLAKVAPGALAVTALDQIGLGGILAAPAKTALGRIGKAALLEGGTEAIQSAIEYANPRVVTGNPVDAGEMFEQAAIGALVGGTMGAGLRGTTEAVTAPFRPKADKAEAEADPAAVMAEFQRIAAEEVANVMAANPGMKQNDAVKFVEENAEALFNRATANLVSGTEGATDVPVTTSAGMDDLGGSGTSAAPDLGTAPPVSGVTDVGETVGGGLEQSVSSVPVSTAGTAIGERPLIEPTAKQVKAVVPTIDKVFEDSALDFVEPYGSLLTKNNKLNAAQKVQAARIIIQSPEVDPYDAISSVLDRGLRLRDEQAAAPRMPRPGEVQGIIEKLNELRASKGQLPIGEGPKFVIEPVPTTSGTTAAPTVPAAPSIDEVAVAPVRTAIEAVTAPTTGPVPTLAQASAQQLGVAPTPPPMAAAPEVPVQEPVQEEVVAPEVAVQEPVQEEVVAPEVAVQEPVQEEVAPELVAEEVAPEAAPASVAAPTPVATYDDVLAEAETRFNEGRITPAGLELVQERVGLGREAQQDGAETRYTPEEVGAALDRVTTQDTKIEISPEGNPETEAEYVTGATHEAAQAILNDFMVGDRVQVGSAPGIVVGLDGDYIRFRPDSATYAKAYHRVPKSSATLVARPDDATTVSASKLEGQDAKFGEEAGQLNADMAGLIQLLGANMYAANVADVSIKELLQNAFDAVKGAVSDKRAPSLYKDGKIEITLNRTDRTITVKDNARGMTPEIVRDAFFTVAGSDKSDLDPQERSGGLGLAKMGFMMGAESIKLDTVRDGVRVKVDATSKEIAGSDFKIVKSPAPAGEHGTTVTVKIPKTYTDPKTGDAKDIWFPYGKDSVAILDKPLIGPVEIKFTYKGGYDSDAPVVLPLGKNFPYDDYQKLEAKFDWGTVDIYYGKDRKKYPAHQVLSSGVYQFTERFKLNQNDTIPYDIIVNVKADVEAKHPDYPFENSRERFKGRLKADIDSLGLYLAKIARGAEAADLKDTMQNVVSLPRVEAGEDLKALEGKLKKSFEKPEGSTRTLPQLPTQVTITDRGVFDTRGRTVVDTTKEAEKKKESTFEATTEAPTRDDFMIELDQDPRNPIFHNNTSFDPIAVGTPYGDPAKFFAELGSLFVEMKEALAASGRWNYDLLTPENMFYAGIGIDKQYGGLHARVPYKAILLNPFFDWGARTLNGVRGNMLNTMIHEIAHTGNMDHGVGHNNEIIKVEQYLYDEGLYDYFRDAVMDILLRHESTYTAMRDAYGQSTTQNIAKSLEDYAEEGGASASAGRDQDGTGDTPEAVPTGGRQGRGRNLSAAASASAEGPESGGTGGGSEPLTDANVEKAVSVKLTKAQIKRLEAAAGIRSREVNQLQKRIIQSRNENETKGLIKRLVAAIKDPDANSGIIASLTQSMPVGGYKFILGFQQIEDIFRLAKLAGMKSIGKIDTIMREEYIPYVNRIVRRASDLEQEWTAFASRNPEGNTTLDDNIMYSNMIDADPSMAATSVDYMRIDPKLKELKASLATEVDANKRGSLKRQITIRENAIKNLYLGGTLKDDNGDPVLDDDGNPVVVQGWNKLPPEGRKIFKAARDFHRANFNEHYRLLMQRIDDAKFDSNDAVKLKSSIEQMFNKARERTIYFPVKRFGEYWLSVGNDFYMRESAAELKALKRKLKGQNETRPMVTGTSRADLRNKVASNDASAALKGILDALDGSNSPKSNGKPRLEKDDMEGLRDLVFQMYLTALPEADMRRRFVHRRFVTGFSTDALRTFAATAVASANQLGRLAYNYKFQNILEEAKAESESDELTPYRDALRLEIGDRVKSAVAPDANSDLLNAINKMIAFGSKLTFYHHLSSAASAAVNLTQLHTLGLPVLSGEFGEAKTAAMAARYTTSILAGREIPNPFRDENGNIALQAPDFKFENSAYMRSLKKSDPERYEQTLGAWEYAQDHDVIESTFASSSQLYERSNTPTGDFNFRQAVRRGEVLTAGQRAAANAMGAMGFMFHATETIGRSVMYMSSFDLAYERAIGKGKTPEQAGMEGRKLATDLTNKGMFDFTNWNKSRFAQAPATRFALQMTSYIHSLSSLMLRSFVGMLPYFNKEGKAAAARVFFGSSGVTALYGGLQATLFSPLIMGAYTVAKYVESLLEEDDEEEEIEQDYLNTSTIEGKLLKYADENKNELGKKNMDYYIRATFIPETFGKGSTLANALGLSDKAAANLATAADSGIPALFGVDISNSVAMGDLPFIWSNVQVKGDTPEVRAYEATARMALGPFGSVGISYVKAADAWNNGDIQQAMELMVPAIIRNPLKATRFQEEGLKIGKDKDIQLKDPSYYTGGKTLLLSLGFKDAETTRNMELDMMAGEVEREVAAQKTELLDRRYRAILAFEKNPSKENETKWNAVERDMDIYNLVYPSNAITSDTKTKSMDAKRRDAVDKAYGLSVNKDIPIREATQEERLEQYLRDSGQ